MSCELSNGTRYQNWFTLECKHCSKAEGKEYIIDDDKYITRRVRSKSPTKMSADRLRLGTSNARTGFGRKAN